MRKIAVVTTSRADYGHLYQPLKAMQAHKDLDPRLIVVGPHLSPEFGHTAVEIERDGFAIEAKLECLLSSDSDVGMAKTIGLATLSLADTLATMRPDILLLIADRYEKLAPASVALALRIPIAHIEGGEVSEGAIDDAVRNALTKMSHIHFVPTRQARRRVIAMGEEAWRVHQSGAPSLDNLTRREPVSRQQLEQRLGLEIDPNAVVVAYHPVTLSKNTVGEADALFEALAQIKQQIVFCFPNADAGSRNLIRRAEGFCAGRDKASLHINLQHMDYWGLISHSGMLLGNSSSGIMETPSLALPTVNIGLRQKGRERAANIIDCEPQTEAILEAVNKGLEPGFRKALAGMTNPYGAGNAGELIADILATAPMEDLLLKKAVPEDQLPEC